MLLGLEQGSHALVGHFPTGVQILLQGLALGFRQLVEIALGDFLALLHLLAHQLAHFALLLFGQVQAVKHVWGALARMLTVLHATRHGYGEGWQGGGEQ